METFDGFRPMLFLRFSDAFAHTLVLVVGRWRCKSSLMVSLLFLESEMGWRRVT
jgi:hypothetical protein